jgi:hypothetical protein
MTFRKLGVAALLSVVMACAANAADSLTFSGFALLRPQTPAGFLFDGNSLSTQLQLGVDWHPAPGFRTYVHLLARNDGDNARRGRAGIVQAFAEKNFFVRGDRVRVMAGAFFLPTSRENVDNLWETPYTISSSALNTWLGEEFRPIGVDATYMKRWQRAGTFTVGGTAFIGNDTFGALPIDRGWAIGDRWSLLGEHVYARTNTYTSVSAENDGRVGWSARAKWNNEFALIQFTRIDNRSDAIRHGELVGWETPFNIAGAQVTWRAWTVAAEDGWGKTTIVTRRGPRTSDLAARYILLSRQIGKFRASVRADDYSVAANPRDRAYTAAVLWNVRPQLRTGVEVITEGGEHRVALEFRYRL